MIVKSLFKLLLVVFTLFALGAYANYLLNGEIPTASGISPSLPDINLSNLTEKITGNFDVEDKSEETYLYKWRDEKGVIYYTSEKPPEEVTNYESIVINSKTNVVPAVPVTGQDKEIANPQSTQSPSTTLPGNVYSADGVEHILNQAKDIQTLVDDQFNQTEVITNQN